MCPVNCFTIKLDVFWIHFTAALISGTSCAIRTSAGRRVVQRGSSFEVYCTFHCRCKGHMHMYSDHPPREQSHTQLNSTTIYLNVANITKNRTYSCWCICSPELDSCGLDISAGYPPERPENMSCIYKVKDKEASVVSCTWNRGRDTFLRNNPMLWVRTGYENNTDEPVRYKGSTKGTGSSSASFTVSGSVQRFSVWVETENPLGSAASITVNYTLWDIAMPETPVLGPLGCSSRECVLQVESQESVPTRRLEVQYRAAAREWTSSPDSGRSLQGRSVSPLEPYTLYHFRARSKFSTGLWSQWSADISAWTQEEAPAKELDVWFAESSDFKSLRVYWKEPDKSSARGRITGYKVRVDGRSSGSVFAADVSADAASRSVPFCVDCEVKVWALNSRGPSPPARITPRHTRGKTTTPPQDVQVTAANLSVTISWRTPATAPPRAAYVVEWFPEGLKLEELRWVRLAADVNHNVLTGVEPCECYEGAVHVFYNGSSVSSTRFTGVATLNSAPAAGPSVQETVEGNQVTVTWTEIPRGQRGGCITKYTIYLGISMPASERRHVIRHLPPAGYSLWMTASTAGGEGRAGQKVKFFIQRDPCVPSGTVCSRRRDRDGSDVSVPHFSREAEVREFWVYFQCLMLDVVPDPANSKWAKECTEDEGEINLKLQPSGSGVPEEVEEEEEPILVDVEELPKQSAAPADVSSSSSSSSSEVPSPETEPAAALYPPTNYIKSFSHDSDGSDHTQTSMDTNATVDYISSHVLGSTEEEEEEEEEEEFAGLLGFFPSHGVFTEPMEFGGKLTLNAVKIDCSDFFFSEQ
uniref:Interleukin 12 receptor, beta 2a n=1 Tax=Cyclopterus lumpus TaxID=8103 RepID=A0A8C2XIZ9_CYCLU